MFLLLGPAIFAQRTCCARESKISNALRLSVLSLCAGQYRHAKRKRALQDSDSKTSASKFAKVSFLPYSLPAVGNTDRPRLTAPPPRPSHEQGYSSSDSESSSTQPNRPAINNLPSVVTWWSTGSSERLDAAVSLAPFVNEHDPLGPAESATARDSASLKRQCDTPVPDIFLAAQCSLAAESMQGSRLASEGSEEKPRPRRAADARVAAPGTGKRGREKRTPRQFKFKWDVVQLYERLKILKADGKMDDPCLVWPRRPTPGCGSRCACDAPRQCSVAQWSDQRSHR